MQKLQSLLAIFIVSAVSLIRVRSISFDSCNNVNDKNLTLLSGTWEVHTDSKIYYISVCASLQTPVTCSGSSICVEKLTEDSGKSLGQTPEVVTNTSDVGFFLDYKTTERCEAGVFSSSITFECGKTLGSPVILYDHNCRADFLWETYLVCKHSDHDPVKSVRCYDFDAAGKKRDLNGIIKRIGGYKVTDPSQSSPSDLYINVCQDISVQVKDEEYEAVGKCPLGSAACLIINDQAFSLGVPKEPVKIKHKDKLVITYSAETGDAKPSSCGDQTPTVTVTFICPGKDRGGNRPPLLTSSVNCQYNIEWWTEAACPIDFVTSTTCGLDSQQHGIDLDLTPLKKDEGVYHVTSTDGMQYWLNVCGVTHQPCGDDDKSGELTTVCQSTSDSKGKICGKLEKYTVSYVDDVLSLTYRNGDRCHSGFRRNTIIVFICNESAGIGTPTFSHEVHCTYYFDWVTSYACVAAAPVCQLTDKNGLRYDLSPLTRIAGETTQGNWEVLTGDTSNKQRFFVNVCSELIRVGEVPTSSCPTGSAVCLVEGDEDPTSYGSYAKSTLVKKGNSLLLTFQNGSSCTGGKTRTTHVSMYCSPGNLESSPVLKYKSSDNCDLELTWHTATACPLKTVTGKNCAVSDEESGLTFDLGRLTRKSNQDMYHLPSPNHDYYINVCGQVVTSSCETGSGACQSETDGQHRSWSLGQVSDELMYYDGFVKLVYKNGDLYSDGVHKRSTQISFLCDPKAGAGKPTFATESNHTYVFNWYTSYVCPTSSVQCMVTDPKTEDQYDLSSLARSEDDADANWSVMDSDGLKRNKYYLNICRPVNEVFGHTHTSSGASSSKNGCDPLAGACQTLFDGKGMESVAIASLGKPIEGPKFESEGHLLLEYVNGSKCKENTTLQYSTRIHFQCTKGKLSSTPRFLEIVNCVVSFIWETEAACAISKTEDSAEKNCEVMDPNSKFIFNLMPLQENSNNPYLVRGTDNFEYEFNICGEVNECGKGFGGCRKAVSNSNIDHKVHNNSQPMYSDDGVLTLYYASNRDDNGNQYQFVISFICNRNISSEKPSFSKVDGYNMHLDFPTHLACQPQAVDCLITDDFGNQYDLTPLSKSSNVVSSPDRTKRFYLRVCQPLNPTANCPVGPIGACMVDPSNEAKSYSIGIVQSNPSAVSQVGQSPGLLDSSTVSITYHNGDRCESDHSRRYSTRILFFCSTEEGQPPTYYSGNPDSCEFVFMWRTPFACKIKKDISTDQSCSVTESFYQMTFDLSPLKQSKDYHVPTNEEWEYDLNICQKLQHSQGTCSESAACQVRKNKSPLTDSDIHDAGKPNSTLVYEDGVVSLTYLHGQKCHDDQYERSTTIRFTCHHGDISSETKPTFINEESDCTYLFDWPTPHVCPPIKIIGCTASLPGENFDLSALSLDHTNIHAATLGDTGDKSYYLNVCRSLLHQKGVLCPPNSAACVKIGKDKYLNLGQVESSPQITSEGDLKLYYTDGEKCKDGNYSTTITFKCNPNQAVLTTPVVTATEENCHVEILWTTKAACPVGTSKASTFEACVAQNPLTHNVFNLTSLAAETYYEVQSETGEVFKINVCDTVIDTKCPVNTSVCMLSNNVAMSVGSMSKNLIYNNGALSLTYNNGAKCAANSRMTHSTVLSFICHRSNHPLLTRPTNEATKPVYIGEDKESCTHYFSWHTFEACEVQTPCAVVDSTSAVPRIIDLSDLIIESGHTVAITDASDHSDEVYFLNVCHPLEPIHGYFCPPGSAACKKAKGHKAESIGYMTHEVMPKLDPNKKTITLTYTTNQMCDKPGSTANVTTKIIFTCVPGQGKGTPHMTTVTDDCTYLFEWANDVICDKSVSTGTSTAQTCSFADKNKGTVYDLTKLEPLNLRHGSERFDLSICGSLGSSGVCADASACLTKEDGTSISIGKTRTFSEGPTDNVAMQAVYVGADCPKGSGKYTTTVMFICSQNADTHFNSPTVITDAQNQCNYIFYWPTHHVCPPLQERCTAADPSTDKTYDLSLLSSISHSHKLSNSNRDKFVLNICRPVHSLSQLNGCPEDAAVCVLKSGENKYRSVGALKSQRIVVNSDKDIEVRYTGGDSALCENRFATTIITFTCGKNVQTAPEFDRFDQNYCIYYITWKSRIACAIEADTVSLSGDGKIVDPKSGLMIDLSSLLAKSWIATGDIRNSDTGVKTYNYIVSLRGNPDLSSSAVENHNCDSNTAVCQYSGTFKGSAAFERVVGEKDHAKYIMSDDALEITLDSTNGCGKDSSKHSHSLISLRCAHYSGYGSPRFVYETNECGYFFQWYSNVTCVALKMPSENSAVSQDGSSSGPDSIVPDSSSHGHAVTTAVIVFCSVAILCILVIVFHKQERRTAFSSSCKRCYWTCCGHMPRSRYRYSRVGDEEGGTSLIEENPRENSSLLQRSKENGTSKDQVSVRPIGGIIDISGEEDNDQDIFGLPEVKIKNTSNKPQKSVRSSGDGIPSHKKAKKTTNPFEDEDDLLDFVPRSKGKGQRSQNNGKLQKMKRSKNVPKVETYHDDDDEDLLEG